MKIIFLDIDGVLNRLGSIEQQRTTHLYHGGFIGMEPELVTRFNALVKATGAGVVLSSSWRLDKKWRLAMFEEGLDMRFIDSTPKIVSAIRGKEIDEWLNRHKVDDYVILDDDSDMMPWHAIHFYQTDYRFGLTQDIADRVINHLLLTQRNTAIMEDVR